MLDEIKFFRDLVVGPRTLASVRTAPSADFSGESGLRGLAVAAKSLVDDLVTSQLADTAEPGAKEDGDYFDDPLDA